MKLESPLHAAMSGQCSRSIEVGGFKVLWASYRPFETELPHAHKHAVLCFVLQGGMTEVFESTATECGFLSISAKAPGVLHANEYGARGAHCLTVEALPDLWERICQGSTKHGGSIYLRSGRATWLAMQLLWEFEQGDAASPMVIEGFAAALIAETWRRRQLPMSQPPHRVIEAERYLREHFDQPIGLSAVAQAVGVHPDYLARLFQRHFKCSVGEFLRLVRIDWAAIKLTEYELPIAFIATAAGFYDQAHFTHVFRNHTGMTPGEFRSQADCLSNRWGPDTVPGLKKTQANLTPGF